MYHIYKTEGFVLDGLNFGESNKLLYIFTKELGLVVCTAQGLRKLDSKLKYGLQNFCYSEIALVRGKGSWRVTSAVKITDLHSVFKSDKFALNICANIFSLAKKMLAGEERDDFLFEILKSYFDYASVAERSEEELKNAELVLLLKFLKRLGYVGKSENLKKIVESDRWDDKLVAKVSDVRTSALAEINRSLKESQMVR